MVQNTFNFYDLRLSTRVKNVSCSAGNEQSIGLPENHFVVVVVLVNEYWKNAGAIFFFLKIKFFLSSSLILFGILAVVLGSIHILEVLTCTLQHTALTPL